MFCQLQHVQAAVQQMMASPLKTATGVPACKFVCLPETASLENDQALLAGWLANGGVIIHNDFDGGLLAGSQLPHDLWGQGQIGARVRLTAGLRAPCFVSYNDNTGVVTRYEDASKSARDRRQERESLVEAAKFNYDMAKEHPATVRFGVLCRCRCCHDYCCTSLARVL